MLRPRSETFSLLLIIISALLMILHQFAILKPAEDFAVLLFAPAQDGLSQLFSGVNHFFGGFREAEEWRQKYEAQQKLVDELLVQNTQLREKEIENIALREALSFKEANQNLKMLPADVVGRDPNPLLHFITIDRGSADGLARGMSVITARGLVGQIVEANVHSAKVILITDLASSVNTLVQESRASGVVQGVISDGEVSGGIEMRFIPQGEKVDKGNIILTSGLGGRFPKGIVVGQVKEIRTHDVELFQTATIRPSVDFQTLETVFVVTNFTGE